MRFKVVTTGKVLLCLLACGLFLTGPLQPMFAADRRAVAGEVAAVPLENAATSTETSGVPFIYDGFEAGLVDWTLQSKGNGGEGTVSLESGSYTGRGDSAGGSNAAWGGYASAGGYGAGGGDSPAGVHSVRIAPAGDGEWRFSTPKKIPVATGDLLELKGWIKRLGSGAATLSARGCDARGNAVEWQIDAPVIEGDAAWGVVATRLVIPPGIAYIQPQLAGQGGGVTWADDLSLTPVMAPRRNPAMPAQARTENAVFSIAVHTDDLTLAVTDKRTGQAWRQQALRSDFILIDIQSGKQIVMALRHIASGNDVLATIKPIGDSPEFTVTLSGEGMLGSALRFPHPFVSGPGTQAVIPRGQGILWPADAPSLPFMRLPAYSGEGLAMPFWGITDGERGLMTLLETPDDSAVHLERIEGKLALSPQWEPQKGRFAYDRRLRYILFDRGGFVAMAKRYREYVRSGDRFVSLEKKARDNRELNKLIGAANIWYEGKGDPEVAGEMKALQFDKVLWNHVEGDTQAALGPEAIQQINALGYLCGRSDLFHQVVNPEKAEHLAAGLDPRWPQSIWPDGLVTGPDGEWVRGWKAKAKDGGWIDGAIVSDEAALSVARWRIPTVLKDSPYGAWLIDGVTSLPWQEDYHQRHPMTRSQSRQSRMNLLKVASSELKRVTGSVGGHDAATPFVHYFEGMMGVTPQAGPGGGVDSTAGGKAGSQPAAALSADHRYGIPLWELVHHDSVLSYWRRDEGNNSLPEQWEKRDLFNILYGTPPLYTLDRDGWKKDKQRLAESYQKVSSVARKVGTAEMTDFRFLTPDRSVQQSVFANGVTVTVNFGSHAYTINAWSELKPMGYLVTDTKK
ncbi:hypothetical protein GTO91_13235 [Heliobacterium undosum]|uniref:Uncharacterized protein n=1 Tax=Heliomicrobium undosum TaxID=121734 RepID=A0A845L4Q1_9FIRM|nr:glycoside hydrolase [Heliomicrobium undosum]MZP30676.1 hypothetical protein [Heliomicrobium undosum]